MVPAPVAPMSFQRLSHGRKAVRNVRV